MYTCITRHFFLIRRVAVPDSRYDFLCEHWKPPSCVPAYLHIVDIAGLVKGAHEGKVSYSLVDTLDHEKHF